MTLTRQNDSQRDHEPPILTRQAWDDIIAESLPIGYDAMADGFPEYTDRIHDELAADGYEEIRRTFETAYPVKKMGHRLAERRLTAKGDGPAVEYVQQVLDRIQGLGPSIESLAWALVEGVRFAWLTWRTDRNGRVIPRLHVRRKTKAGGRIEWDGETVVMRREYGMPFVDRTDLDRIAQRSTEEMQPRKLPRERLIVWQPVDSGNPEGDTDLAWWLYLMAEDAQNVRKNKRLYIKRHGLPHELIRKSLEGVRGPKVQERLEAARATLQKLEAGRGVALDAKDAIGMMEPSGQSWQILMEEHADLRKRAHMAVLMESLSSETTDSGPTGSSTVHQTQGDRAVAALAGSLGETLTRDLLPGIELYNAPLMPAGEVREITLEEIEAESEPSHTPLDLYKEGVTVLAEDVYAAGGAQVPPGTPEVLTREAQPDPFGGGGGWGFMKAKDADAPKRLSIRERKSSARALKDSGAARKLAIRQAARDRLLLQALPTVEARIWDGIRAYLDGGDVSPDLARDLGYVMADAHMAGRRSLSGQLSQRGIRKLQAADVPRGVLRLAVAEEAVEALADVYRQVAYRAVYAANDQVREHVHRKLVSFVREGGEIGDTEDFVDWLMEQEGDFSESYSRLVLRNAINTAHSAGENEEFWEIAPVLGLKWRYVTAEDESVRAEHRVYHNLVFDATPEAESFKPPNGHNCRCTWVVEEGDVATTARLSALPRPEWDEPPGGLQMGPGGFLRLTAADGVTHLCKWVEYEGALCLAAVDEDKRKIWRTINGSRVQIDTVTGEIVDGPPDMRGKKPGELGDQPTQVKSAIQQDISQSRPTVQKKGVVEKVKEKAEAVRDDLVAAGVPRRLATTTAVAAAATLVPGLSVCNTVGATLTAMGVPEGAALCALPSGFFEAPIMIKGVKYGAKAVGSVNRLFGRLFGAAAKAALAAATLSPDGPVLVDDTGLVLYMLARNNEAMHEQAMAVTGDDAIRAMLLEGAEAADQMPEGVADDGLA